MNFQFQRGDILISAPGWTAGCYCIVDIEPSRSRNPYIGLNLVNRKQYRLGREGLIKVGTATAEFLAGNHEVPGADLGAVLELNYRHGRERAEREALQATGENKMRWEILAGFRPGERIKIQHSCGHSEEINFQYVLVRGSRFVFVCENKGKLYRYPLEAIPLANPLVRSSTCTCP